MKRTLEGAAFLLRVVVVAVTVGAVLGALTKATLVLFRGVIDVVWEWLPEQIGVVPSSVGYIAAALGIGGLLVGLGQRLLGYHPRPLDTVVDDIEQGVGIDHRTIPQTLVNSVAALGFGAPLGPEAALVAVVGGVFYWAKQHMEDLALEAYHLLRGRPDDDVSRGWQYAPAVLAGIVVVLVFRALPGGADLAFVPRYSDPGSPSALILALAAGLVGGLLGVLTDGVEVRVRALRLFDRSPVAIACVGGLVVAALAVPSDLVLFSGTDNMHVLFDGSASDATLTYAAVAKWVGVMVVFATGWKGGPVFPLMFISGALAVAVGDVLGVEPVVLYAGGVAGAASGALGSTAFGALAALLVVPPSLFLLILAGAAGSGVVLVARRHASEFATSR
jgi:H+/Cl- antiporter ClcA